jgi:hypothetical protein
MGICELVKVEAHQNPFGRNASPAEMKTLLKRKTSSREIVVEI